MKPSEKLAQSLELLRNLQKMGTTAIRSRDLTRTHLSRLTKNGFLREVLKGWYISCRPDETQGESTFWYISFWQFCASYLNKRFKNAWCLSPEQSLLLHAENWTVPKQLLVRSLKGNNKITKLPFDTSFLDVRYTMPNKKDIEEKNGLRVFAKIPALITCSPTFFIRYPTDSLKRFTRRRHGGGERFIFSESSRLVSKLFAWRRFNIFRSVLSNDSEFLGVSEPKGMSFLGLDFFITFHLFQN